MYREGYLQYLGMRHEGGSLKIYLKKGRENNDYSPGEMKNVLFNARDDTRRMSEVILRMRPVTGGARLKSKILKRHKTCHECDLWSSFCVIINR